jgi:hypothetical protein
MPVILALWGLRQENYELRASLGYRVRPASKNNNNKNPPKSPKNKHLVCEQK